MLDEHIVSRLDEIWRVGGVFMATRMGGWKGLFLGMDGGGWGVWMGQSGGKWLVWGMDWDG